MSAMTKLSPVGTSRFSQNRRPPVQQIRFQGDAPAASSGRVTSALKTGGKVLASPVVLLWKLLFQGRSETGMEPTIGNLKMDLKKTWFCWLPLVLGLTAPYLAPQAAIAGTAAAEGAGLLTALGVGLTGTFTLIPRLVKTIAWKIRGKE